MILFKPGDEGVAPALSNSAFIFSTEDWSPRSASMPAICVKLAVHEVSSVTAAKIGTARSGRITP